MSVLLIISDIVWPDVRLFLNISITKLFLINLHNIMNKNKTNTLQRWILPSLVLSLDHWLFSTGEEPLIIFLPKHLKVLLLGFIFNTHSMIYRAELT